MVALAKRSLKSLELVIDRGLTRMRTSWRQVADALREVNERRLYLGKWSTWEAYCWDRWQLSRSWAYELIATREADEGMSGRPDIQGLNPSQIRPLLGLTEEDQDTVLEGVAEDRANGRKVTAARVEELAAKVLDGKTLEEKRQAVEESGRKYRDAVKRNNARDTVRTIARLCKKLKRLHGGILDDPEDADQALNLYLQTVGVGAGVKVPPV